MARASFTDIEIIENIKKGNTNLVLKYVYFKYEKDTIAWIRKNNGNRAEAQDIFQESILALYQYIIENKYEDKYPIGAFLMRVSKNKWINRAKKLNREVKSETIDETLIQNEEKNTKPKDSIIKQVLAQLGETCKELLTYSVLYDISMEDISIRMGLKSADVAKTKNYKCKKRLEKYLNDNPGVKQKLIS